MANLDDARRRAEEALVFMDAALLNEMPPLPTQVKALADSVRALLAASDPAAGEREEKGPRCPFCDTARIERDARLDLWVCHVCKRSWAVAEEPATPTRPAQDAVREAAERCRVRVDHAFDPDCPCDQNTNCYAGVIADLEALLAALARLAQEEGK